MSFCPRGIVCLAFFLAVAPALPASDAATDQLLSKARSLEGRGRLDLAARAWEQTLLADPNNAEALLGLAKFAKQSGHVEEANRYLERLRNLDPKNPAIGAVEGMASVGKQRSGIEEASRLAAARNFEGAMRIYRSLFGNEPPPGGVAIGYYETEASTPGGWNDAVAGMERLANKYPESEDYRLSLGRLETYREPTRLHGMEMLALVKGDAQIVNRARSAWRQALVWSAGNPSSSPMLAEYLSRYPDPELQKLLVHPAKAVEATQRQIVREDNVEAGLGYSFLNAQKLDEAEKHFRTGLNAAPHNPVLLAGMGYVRMKQEDFHAAGEFFQQSLEAQPKNKSVVEALGAARFWEQMKAGGTALTANESDLAVKHFAQAYALRPNSEQAAESLANSYMQSQQPALAAPLYEKLTGLNPQTLNYWYGLVKAKYQSGSPADALASLKQAPPQIKDEWAKSPSELSLLASIYADEGDIDQSRRTVERAVAGKRNDLPLAQQLELAGLLLRLGHNSQAADSFLKIAVKYPANVDAWNGSLNALLEMRESARAYDVLQRIPQRTYALALTKPDFLRSLARLQTLMKRYDLAEKSLKEVARLDSEQGKEANLNDRIQLAEIAAHLHRTGDAEKLLRSITDAYPADKRAWTSLVALLHEEKADSAAIVEFEKMPEAVLLEARNDAGFVVLEASVYLAAGQKDRALWLVRQSQKHFEMLGQGVPVPIDTQLAWLLLESPDGQPELAKILERDTARADLTSTQRSAFERILSFSSQRRAQAAIAENDYPKALSILRAAGTSLPGDTRIEAMLASTLLRSESFDKAFEAYERWDLKGAEATDFRGAVGAASAAHKDAFAAKWLARGLQQYPADPRLLRLAGEQAAQHRDYKLAESFFRKALAVLPSNEASIGETSEATRAVALPPPQQTAGQGRTSPVSIKGYSPDARIVRVATASRTPVLDTQSGGSAIADVDPILLNRTFSEGYDISAEPGEAEAAQPVEAPASTPKPDDPIALQEQIQSELEAVEARNAPYLQEGVNVQQRSGQGGFDKLLIEEAQLGASTTIADRVRLTLIAVPTYIDSGSPSAPADNGHLGFGTAAVDGTPGVRSEFGVGGEAQLATADLGLRVGLTPEEFLVHGWVAGLRWNPAHSPFTILLDRDPVRDTKLSFAGERDPGTQRVWGGVMATGVSLMGNWSHGSTGYYAKADYQDLEGERVARNNRIEANIGSYFKAYRNKQGELTIGLNLTGMHYDQNLRYFTLGQGGYFSPQQYFLFNVPAHWTGNVNRRLQYSISASLGVQHFTENASAYFPTDASQQAVLGLSYPSYTNTSGNYNLSIRTIYQITPQWLGGAFFDVNNAREYRSVTAGLYLKYLLKPRPIPADFNPTAVPDWTGASPFNVP